MGFAAAISDSDSASAPTASAATINIRKLLSLLDVKIEMVGNTGVKASITNTGKDDLIMHVFDVAELHDLSAAGVISMISESALQYARSGDTQIFGYTSSSSNLLSIIVDDFAASKIFKAVPRLDEASADLVLQATSVAETEDDELIKHFKNANSSTSSRVVDIFNAVASESSSTSSGALWNPVQCIKSQTYKVILDRLGDYTMPNLGHL
ncbi:hypothetical protein GGR55DRAFT_681484 [Xylaria sp. FL0064]|nr:hypothetical protein GGR55DRAFT_681484 [Xylaria sp. FL0064]